MPLQGTKPGLFERLSLLEVWEGQEHLRHMQTWALASSMALNGWGGHRPP